MSFFKAFFEGAKSLPFWALGIRAVILYIALIIATRLMRHRQVGILTGHNYLVAAGIVSLAAVRMINPKSSLTSALVIIFAYAGVNVVLSYFDLKFPWLVDRKPVILMQDGQIDRKKMKDAHVTLDNLLGQLRLKGAYNLSEIHSIVLEPTGKISVVKRPFSLPVTRKQLNLPPKFVGLPVVLVYNGHIQKDNLVRLGLNSQWLMDKLNQEGYTESSQVLLAVLESSGKLYITM